ncbi:hypothetical protein FocTR4_00015154 [Fusarium oxysporum f. sp. cubense]|uniref:Uncharacterized protein n=1 Tax=Fusarium oxysporum f. sp. cubense TaxID=61366 RepID=A0A5C6SWJ8_FUSOC|nr:hypothetical protein FocTR4_00015154 [Fusarium oxysporum f. sp. cubense]
MKTDRMRPAPRRFPKACKTLSRKELRRAFQTLYAHLNLVGDKRLTMPRFTLPAPTPVNPPIRRMPKMIDRSQYCPRRSKRRFLGLLRGLYQTLFTIQEIHQSKESRSKF